MSRRLHQNPPSLSNLQKQLKESRKKRQHVNLHKAFERLIKTCLGLSNGMVTEHKFHPIRRYRFDFAWPHLKIGVDLQGGIYAKHRRSGHVSPKGMENDMQKLNLAMTNGWVVLLFSPNHIRKEGEYVLRTIKSLHFVRTRRD